jgi:hypothetical protein
LRRILALERRTAEGPKSAVSGAMDGVANVAEAMPRRLAFPALMADLEPGNRIPSMQVAATTTLELKSKTDFGHPCGSSRSQLFRRAMPAMVLLISRLDATTPWCMASR